MPPAVAAAGIVAAGTIGGAVLGGSAQKSAAKQASSAELQVAQQNNALAEKFRTENQANFQPFLNSGTRANGLIDSFLYGPGPVDYHTGQMPAHAPAPTLPPTGVQTAPVVSQTPVHQANGAMTPAHAFQTLGGRTDRQDLAISPVGPLIGHNAMLGGLRGGASGAVHPGTTPTAGGVTATPTTPQAGGAAQSPFSGYAAFINSPFYQFGQQEGMRALNGGLASRGLLESGDAIKSAIRYGQDYGYSQGLMPYLGLAGDQAGRGVQSAGAIAGVGVNALNSMSANNANAGNAMANAALARGAASSGMYSGIGSALGNFAGSLFPTSSYGGGGSAGTPNYGAISGLPSFMNG